MTMRHALFTVFLLVTVPAFASPSDDYVACLIGRAAVALHAQTGEKDASEAQEIAYDLCGEPTDTPENEAEGLSDYVNLMVERMAAE
jgi:hypothetical protein